MPTLCFTILVAAGLAPAVAPAEQPDGAALAGTGWQFVSATIGVPAPPDVSRMGLRFTEASMSASSGCNTGHGPYTLEGGVLVAGNLAATRMACVGALADWEPVFFRFLSSKPVVKRAGDQLVLTSAQGEMQFRSRLMPSASAQRKFIYVASERKACTGEGPMQCLQIRENPADPWQLYYGEIVGFTLEPGIEYRLRILEDQVPDPPAGASSRRWFLDMVVEQKVVKR